MALSIAVILLITLVPTGQHVEPLIRLCLICGTSGLASLLLNVVLFMPLGVALRLRGGAVGMALAAGFALSLGIELTQLMVPGRYTTLADLVANTAGAGLGALLAVRTRGWLLPDDRAGRLLASLWAVAVSFLIVFGAVLFEPSTPDGSIHGQWTPRLETLQRYEGRVLSARIGNFPLPPTLLPDQGGVRGLLRTDAPMEIRFLAGSSTRGLAPVFRLVAGSFGESREAFQLGIDGDDLVVRPRFRADDLRLTRPDFRIRGAMAPVSTGDTVRVRIWREPDGGHRVALRAEAPVLLGVTAARGWSLLRYFGRGPEWMRTLADHLWIMGLLAPIGWWARRPALLVPLVVTPLAVLVLVPLTTPLLPTPASPVLTGLLVAFSAHVLRSAAQRVLPDGADGTRG